MGPNPLRYKALLPDQTIAKRKHPYSPRARNVDRHYSALCRPGFLLAIMPQKIQQKLFVKNVFQKNKKWRSFKIGTN